MGPLDRRLSRAGASIAFSDTGGHGPGVVFTPGAGLDHTIFEKQARNLSDHGFRIITWDVRAHGQSTMSDNARFTATDVLRDLSALLQACRLRRPILIGHSFGGNICQTFVRKHPDRVSGLIVLAATWNTGPLTWLQRSALRSAAPLLAMVPERRLPRLMAKASAMSPEAIERATQVFGQVPKDRFLQVWRATVSMVRPDPFYRTPVPVGLIRGAEDTTGNIASAMARWAQAEGLCEHVVAHAGHLVTWDAPEETSRILLTILQDWELTG